MITLASNNVKSAEHQLQLEVGNYYTDLYGWIMFAYPWGEKGTALEKFDGPEYWVKDVAAEISEHVIKHKFNGMDPVPPVFVAIASGNGCAKSSFAGMVNNWILSTRPMSLGTITANTGNQIRTKTWPEIEKWTQLSITSHWFECQAQSVFHKKFPRKWAANAQPWNLQNTQAFAGQHARTGSSFYIWDEASHIPEAIMEQADGGLTDGEPFWIMLGNPKNRYGRLYRAVFGNLQSEFIHRSIDSRSCRFTNKERIEKWKLERGEDSDWFKAHVKGEPPNADETQFIDNARVSAARRRVPVEELADEPLIMSIDFARGGSAFNVIGFRKGRDAKGIPAKRIGGDKTRDTMLMVAMITELVHEHKPDAIMGDATGIGGPIMDRLRQLIKNIPIFDVVNGATAYDDTPGKPSKYKNVRAYCWGKMKEWLVGGCIEDHEQLENEIVAPGFFHNEKDQLTLESKEDMEERGEASPDWADQLAMTFAHIVKPKPKTEATKPKKRMPIKAGSRGWMRR